MINAAPRAAQYIEGANNTGVTIPRYLAVSGGPADLQLPASVSAPVLGITRQDILDGSLGDVQYSGVAIGTAGETISAAAVKAGVRLYADTAGKLFIWDAAAGVNQSVIGVAISPASGADDIFDVLLGVGGIGQGA